MRLYQIAYRSLLERKAKSIFLIIGLSLGLLAIITLMTITQFLSTSLTTSLKEHGANILILPRTETISLTFNGITVANERIQEHSYISSNSIDMLKDILATSDYSINEKTDLGVIELHLKTDSIDEIKQLLASIEILMPEVQATVSLGNFDSRQQLFEEFNTYTVFTILILIVVSVFLITATMMASVNERFPEFGVMRSAGYRKKNIASIILTETILLFIVSFVITTIIGLVISNLVLATIYSSQYKLFIPITSIIYIGLSGAIVSLLAALYPAMKAANLDPIEAVKKI
jgi:ABC-type antimicrobial peptide transport system permease subunit